MAEYFSPRAKQRLCFSQYKGADHMLGTLPQVSFFISLFFFLLNKHVYSNYTIFLFCLQGMWQCNHCGTKSGKGVGKSHLCTSLYFKHSEATSIC